LRWCLGVAALVNRHRRAGASALTKLLRWRIGGVELVIFTLFRCTSAELFFCC
jgi:hypothetical protein